MDALVAPQRDSMGDTAGAELQRLIAVFRRRFRVFGVVAFSVLAAAVIVVLTQPPQYIATATVALNAPAQPIVTVTPNSPPRDENPDSATVETEVEVLQSRALAQRVVEELKLDRDPAFNGQKGKSGVMSIVAQMLSGRSAPSASPQRGAAASTATDAVMGGLKVGRVGLTYLINVSYVSGDPAKAALIANAYTRAYLRSQLDSRSLATSDANDWLSDRLNQLRSQVETADTELQQYKIANNLLSSQGATLTEQEISTLDQQLAMTKAQEAEAVARLSTARRQLASGSTGEDVGEALSSPVIQQLRQQRAITSKTVADLQGRYGDRHPEMLKAKRELADLDSQIQGEIQRIISNLEAQAQVAKQRTASIQASVGQSRGKLVGNNRAVVRLNELQRNADAARTLYETLLNRFKETSVEKGLQHSTARIVSEATTPKVPNGRKEISILLGAVIALSAGIMAVLVAELLDNAISDGDVLESELGLSNLGSIPLLSSAVDAHEYAGQDPESYVTERPLSSFTEAVRNLNASIVFSRIGQSAKVIAVTSSLPGEGKTTTAICLARTIALSGKSVVLVDCDLRQQAVKRILAEEPSVGLMELLNGDATLDKVLVADTMSSTVILPVTSAAFTPKDMFGTQAMKDLIVELRERFDVIVLDTAPVLLVTETRTVLGLADVSVLLVRWRKTSKRAVGASVKLIRAAGAPLAGAALNQVDLLQISSISQSDPAAYYKAYKKYYQS